MRLSDFLKNNADTLGNDILGKVSEALGGPELPPLKFETPNQNPNNYVQARPAPAQTQPEVTPKKSTNWMLYGGLALGVVLVVGLLVRK